MLETDFSAENVFLTLDSNALGVTTAFLGVRNSIGIGGGIETTFTGILTDFPTTDVLNIFVDGVPIPLLVTDKTNVLWTISGTGLVGSTSTINSSTGEFSINFIVAPGSLEEILLDYSALSSEWSSISGIREGFRILTDDNQGEAVLLQNPQFQSNSVAVNVILSPSSTLFEASDWILRVPSTNPVGDLVPRHIKNSLILPEYFDSLQKVSVDEIQDAAIRLRNIRRWDVVDEEYLDVFLQTLGMFFKSDVFTAETKRRFIKELPAFLELSGTKYTFNYLMFVTGVIFTNDQLWTMDYKDFILEGDIPGGQEDLYYPTNHVQLNSSIESFGVIEPQTIVDIFYILASVPLVLQHVNQILVADLLNVIPTFLGVWEVYYTAEDITP